MEETRKNKRINDEDEEAAILQSAGGAVQEQHSYESQVLKEAIQSNAPTLSGVGFPDLNSIVSTRIHNNSKRVKMSPQQQRLNDQEVTHVLTTLRNVKADLDAMESSTNNESKEAQILRMKYHILLTYLATNTSVKCHELGISLSRDKQIEDRRSNNLLRRKIASKPPEDGSSAETSRLKSKSSSKEASYRLERIKAGEDNLSNNISFGKQAVEARKATLDRVRERATTKKLTMMGSKKDMAGDAWIDPKVLYEKRMARLERRKRRRGEKGFDKQEASTSRSTPVDNHVSKTAPSPCLKKSQVVHCGICEQDISVPHRHASDVDSFLSRHMQSCSGRRKPPLRSGTISKRFVNDDEIGDIESSDDELSESVSIDRKQEFSDKKFIQKHIDDFDEHDYEDRVDDWLENGISNMKNMSEKLDSDETPGAVVIDGEYEIPAWINDRLFGYQRTGLRWLWELHQQECGGILGDEMGLGKTIQICSFLGSMASSRKLKSVLIIAPATLLSHWLTELSIWAPGLRRILLHSSGEYNRTPSRSIFKRLDTWLNHARADRLNEPIDEKDFNEHDPNLFIGTGYVVLTTYDNIRRHAETWVAHQWSYVIVDEGQKIRNPDADVTIACKRLRTSNRILLSGTPIQNDLRELWSLFDFVFPGRLGTLPVFLAEFADPIKRGGYSNASPMQVQLAYRCALVLRDLINPYLLRRQKKDIEEITRMPGKTENVLFCKLSGRQRRMYEAYLQSDEVRNIIRGSKQCFGPIITLRKICNHPDLICGSDQSAYESFLRNGFVNEEDIGDTSSEDDSSVIEIDQENLIERSGKLEILAKILPLWKKQGHRVLIFSQWKKMLNIIQHFMNIQGYKYKRLDGNTNVGSRQNLVDKFNNDDSIFAMLLTTKTGGVGLNLTGANRIILYDPDWNPQSDAQARERAFRFGQTKAVTVYRLITAGTIEEKIYQRQIFKTAITNQVLQDPRQRRMFSQNDLRDLFTLKNDVSSMVKGGDGVTETGEIAKGRGVIDVDDMDEVEVDDNKETIEEVLKSKGLAGIFDHDTIDNPFAKSSLTEKEMELQAKQRARKAAAALAESLTSSGQNNFTPTWTGATGAEPKRFGGITKGNIPVGRFGSGVANIVSTHDVGEKTLGLGQKPALTSSSLLDQIQKRRNDIATGGESTTNTSKEDDFAIKLMKRIKSFLKLYFDKCGRGPTTSEILEEFKSVNSSDAALFKSMLKHLAAVNGGRWQLKSKSV